MAHCIHQFFDMFLADKEEIPSKEQIFDATVIEAFLVNAFGCIDNLARIWVHEKPVKTVKGKPLPKGEIGLFVHHTRVRTSLSKGFQEYLETLNEWLTFMGNFRHALAHRIPLYIPPYAVRTQDEATYEEIEKKMIEASQRGELAEYERLPRSRISSPFMPLMHHSISRMQCRQYFTPSYSLTSTRSKSQA